MGGFALLDEHRNLIYLEQMPLLAKGYNYKLVYQMIHKLPQKTTILLELKPGVCEKSASPPTSFGFHCGVLYGLCFNNNLIIIAPKI